MNPGNGKSTHLVFAIGHFCLAAFFAYAFYDRFWLWRHEISQVNSGFLTPEGANVTSGGMFWILPAIVFAVLGGLRVARYTSPLHRTPDPAQIPRRQ